ncbi:MAG TPA: tetratricopeptide repeat protein [Candidatus Krumholzibacteria bacterium]|nr:tetratricopeptide repeat protein [Candidatus Krumholzibacteria bacterium]
MTVSSEALYYVLREGSTREEQVTWSDAEQLCRSGKLTPQARIFLPEEERWAVVGETRLAAMFRAGSAEGGGEENDMRAGIEAEYKQALERIETEPDMLEAHLDAGILADELGKRDEARAHFQTVLHRYPYHARAAAEVHRRFNKVEQKKIRYLDRPAPVWEDILDLARIPFGRGPLYVMLTMLAFELLSFVPAGWVASYAIAFLWAFQVMEYTARGGLRLPDWNRSFKDPWRKLARPALLMSAVVAQWLLIVVGSAKIESLVKHGEMESLWYYVTQSPVILVVGSILGVLYLPAAMVSLGGFSGPVTKTLDPRRLVRTIVRMEHEYVYSVMLIAAIVIVLGILRMTIGAIPVVGDLVFAWALACAAPMCGLILGRLLGRMGHVIE